MDILKKSIAVLSAVACLISSNMMLSTTKGASRNLITAYAAETTQVWDGSIDTSWYDSQETEMHITTAEELAGLAAIVNGGKSMAGHTIVLDNDIYLNSMVNVEKWSTEPPEDVWKSIGSKTNCFAGTFDGGNHTIHGLYKNVLFGGINEGTIKNISVENAYIIDNLSTLCGVNDKGTISNCHVNSEAKGNNVFLQQDSAMYNCYGGVCGSNEDGIISDCTNFGSIDCSSGYVISDNDSLGGICGYNTGIVTDSANYADIKGGRHTGGIIGYGGNGINLYNNGSVKMGYYRSYTCGFKNVNYNIGGITGYADADMKNCVNDGSVNIESDFYETGSAVVVVELQVK